MRWHPTASKAGSAGSKPLIHTNSPRTEWGTSTRHRPTASITCSCSISSPRSINRTSARSSWGIKARRRVIVATPYRSTVTVDGTKFQALSVLFAVHTDKDHVGMPQMGSLQTDIRVWVDFHDDTNFPHATMKKLFDLANVVTREKVKDIKIEMWKDDAHQDALCSYQFKGWISGFHTSNPANGEGANVGAVNPETVNHLLVLDIEPALNQQNFKDVKMSN